MGRGEGIWYREMIKGVYIRKGSYGDFMTSLLNSKQYFSTKQLYLFQRRIKIIHNFIVFRKYYNFNADILASVCRKRTCFN